MSTNYYPFLTFNEARIELAITKTELEELIADKVIIVKDLGGKEDFYIDHISFEKYKVKHGGKKERCREFLIELINTEKKKQLIKLKRAIDEIKTKEQLEMYGGLSSFTVQDLSHKEILHYNDLIKVENARIKKEKKALLRAELLGENITTQKKLDLSGAKVFGYSKTKEFVLEARKKYKI